MAIRRTAKMGNPILRCRSEEVPHDLIKSPDVQRLIKDMIETMREYQGVGLAAPQVHERIRLFTAEIANESDLKVIINPIIKPLKNEVTSSWEGCLSIPNIRGLVERCSHVRVDGYDEFGNEISFEASNFLSAVVQHETDHLDGVLFIDRMENLQQLSFVDEYFRFYHKD